MSLWDKFFSVQEKNKYVIVKVLFIKFKIKLKYFLHVEKKIVKELLKRSVSNTVLMVEENPFHGEIISGYVKYLLDLGFSVDLFLNAKLKLDDAMCRFKSDKINIFYMNPKTMKVLLNDENLVNKYKFMFINSFHLFSFDYDGPLPVGADKYFGNLKAPKNSFITSVFHRTDLIQDETLLKKFNGTTLAPTITNAPVVNPHYFGDVQITRKNDQTKFLISGDGYKTFESIISLAEKLIESGNKNFKIYITGRFKHDELKPELSEYIEFLGFLDFDSLYTLVEHSDFLIPCLDPDNEKHDWYTKTGTSGSFQLSMGFLKPVILHSKFANHVGFNNENSLVYENEHDFIERCLSAINMDDEQYQKMQNNLKILADSIYEKSLNNLKEIIKNNGVIINE